MDGTCSMSRRAAVWICGAALCALPVSLAGLSVAETPKESGNGGVGIHGGKPQGEEDNARKIGAAMYYCAATNGVALIENLIEVRSLFYAVNWDRRDATNSRPGVAWCKDRIPDAVRNADDLFDSLERDKSGTDEVLGDIIMELDMGVSTLEGYATGIRRTREEWVKTLGRDRMLELLATEAHYKAKLFERVESRIRKIQKSEKEKPEQIP